MSVTLKTTGVQFADSTLQTTAFKGIGVNQTWQNMTASRALSTTYTNTTGLPIMVSVVLDINSNITVECQMYVDGLLIYHYHNNPNNSGIGTCVSAIVPPGSTYSITSTGIPIQSWAELR